MDLLTCKIVPDYGSIPVNRSTGVWISLFLPLLNDLPFRTNAQEFCASRIRLIPQSTKPFLSIIATLAPKKSVIATN